MWSSCSGNPSFTKSLYIECHRVTVDVGEENKDQLWLQVGRETKIEIPPKRQGTIESRKTTTVVAVL